MLYNNPPALVLEPDGVTFYPDHEDPLTWYYQPFSPRVSRDEKKNPLLRLTKYVSEKQALGLLDFDVNLGLDPEKLPDYRARLRRALDLSSDPRILPMQAIEGSVEVMLLGQMGGDKSSTGLVTSVSHAAAPALYGDNRAAFSILLTPDGSEIVEASLKANGGNGISAVVVIYSLTFNALRPAYAIRARASWAQVHDYMKEQLSFDSVFAGSTISKIVDDMKDKKIIDIQVDNMLPPDQQGAALQAMLGDIKTLIFDKFFKPAIPPPQEKKPTFLDSLTSLMKEGAKLNTLGGLGFLGHFQWIREDRIELSQQDLSIDLNERTLTQIKLHPQAHLSELTSTLADWSPIQELNASSGREFFSKRSVRVGLNIPLSTDTLSSVVVDLKYGNQLKSLAFRQGDEEQKQLVWNSLLDNDGRTIRDVQATFTVNFGVPTDITWPTQLVSKPQLVQGDYLTLAPRSLYTPKNVQFMMPSDFNWTQYPFVELVCRYVDEQHGVQFKSTLPLDAGHTSRTFSYLQLDANHQAVEYRLILHSASGAVIDSGIWTSTSTYLVMIDLVRRNLTLSPPSADKWPDGVDTILVTLSYNDPANNYSLKLEPVQFTRGSAMQQVRIPIVDPKRQVVSYQVSYYGDRTVQGPLSRTEDPLIAIPGTPSGRSFTVLRPDPSLFDGGQIVKVVVKVRGQKDQSSQGTFRSAKDSLKFSYDFLEDPTFRCKLTYTYRDTDPFSTKEFEVGGAEEFLISAPTDR